jgi:hypothetical protein
MYQNELAFVGCQFWQFGFVRVQFGFQRHSFASSPSIGMVF